MPEQRRYCLVAILPCNDIDASTEPAPNLSRVNDREFTEYKAQFGF